MPTKRKVKQPKIPLRWVVRSFLSYSQESIMILQCWHNGEWVDVPTEKEFEVNHK